MSEAKRIGPAETSSELGDPDGSCSRLRAARLENDQRHRRTAIRTARANAELALAVERMRRRWDSTPPPDPATYVVMGVRMPRR